MSANILWEQIIKAPYIFNPTVYLLRHATEVLLKGLLIKEYPDDGIDINDISLVINGENRKLNATHSLDFLWKNYKTISNENRLFPCYSQAEEVFIDKTIAFFDKYDPSSMSYRYPYDKKGSPISILPVDINNAEVISSIGDSPKNIVEYNNQAYCIKKGVKYLLKTRDLFVVADLFMKFLQI